VQFSFVGGAPATATVAGAEPECVRWRGSARVLHQSREVFNWFAAARLQVRCSARSMRDRRRRDPRPGAAGRRDTRSERTRAGPPRTGGRGAGRDSL